MSAGALDGIKVFEFANYVSGPYAGMLLSDLGAEVVKVESPDGGDPFRMWGKTDYNGTFGSMNRNKKSVTLDLKTKDGQAAARKLALSADVIIENFRSGAMERLGLGYEALAADNPRLIYCSITGFGSEGPYRSRPGYDTVGQAMSGLAGGADGPQGAAADGHFALGSSGRHVRGLWRAGGADGAHTSGRGQKVETSLLQATLAFLGENAANLFRGRPRADARDAMPARAGLCLHRRRRAAVRRPSVVAGKILARPAGGDKPRGAGHRRAVPDREARVKNYDALCAELTAAFQARPRAEWLAAARGARTCRRVRSTPSTRCSPIRRSWRSICANGCRIAPGAPYRSSAIRCG